MNTAQGFLCVLVNIALLSVGRKWNQPKEMKCAHCPSNLIQPHEEPEKPNICREMGVTEIIVLSETQKYK